MLLTFLVFCAAIAPFAIARAVIRNRAAQRAARAATIELIVDEFGVRRGLADGREEGIDWSEILECARWRTVCTTPFPMIRIQPGSRPSRRSQRAWLLRSSANGYRSSCT